MTEAHFYLLVVGFVVQLILIAVGGTWRLSRVEASINKTIADHRKEVDERISAMMLEFERRVTENERRYGETVGALRTKIHEVETWTRDQFVREQSFSAGMNRLENSISDMGSRLETRLLRMENKIDQVKDNGAT